MIIKPPSPSLATYLYITVAWSLLNVEDMKKTVPEYEITNPKH